MAFAEAGAGKQQVQGQDQEQSDAGVFVWQLGWIRDGGRCRSRPGHRSLSVLTPLAMVSVGEKRSCYCASQSPRAFWPAAAGWQRQTCLHRLKQL
jgi:hypothetical protein